MRTLSLVGIGCGGVGQLTEDARRTIRAADVVLVVEKGEHDALAELRRRLCAAVAPEVPVVVATDPARDRAADDYGAAVADWHDARTDLYERLLRDEVPEGGRAAVLVWGDPSLYDSTLRIVDRLRRRDTVEVDHEVVPGVSSLHALCAAHRIPLNRVGAPVLVTTGRRLAEEGLPAGIQDVVVFLDGRAAFREVDPDGAHIWWGAYLGMPEQTLVSGPLADAADEIASVRSALRATHGWIFDAYLIRRDEGGLG